MCPLRRSIRSIAGPRQRPVDQTLDPPPTTPPFPRPPCPWKTALHSDSGRVHHEALMGCIKGIMNTRRSLSPQAAAVEDVQFGCNGFAG